MSYEEALAYANWLKTEGYYVKVPRWEGNEDVAACWVDRIEWIAYHTTKEEIQDRLDDANAYAG